jgi:hypothetical protein
LLWDRNHLENAVKGGGNLTDLDRPERFFVRASGPTIGAGYAQHRRFEPALLGTQVAARSAMAPAASCSTDVPGLDASPKRIAVAFAIAGLLASACAGGDNGADAANESEATANGRVASHGMNLAGDPANAWISHVPLFAAPHDVQMIAAGAMTSVNGSPLPPSFSDQLFTFLPDSISLDALRTGALTTLEGKLFVGSFEHDGRPLAGRFRFSVSRVVHQHVLDKQTSQPALTYVLVGSRERAFAIHKVAGTPGFDEVVRVELGGDAPPNDALAVGVEALVTGASDTPTSRIGLADAPRTMQAGSRTFTAKRAASLSCLVGPDFFDFCR